MIFAVGDNDGNISVWRLTQSKETDDAPMMLIKGHKNGAELIEDLAWNSMGNLLMASTAKRYLILMNFTTSFGIEISEL
jgi:protein HIRA/HIR1